MECKTEQKAFWGGEFGNQYIEWNKDSRLLNFGFAYQRAPNFVLDAITWFLMEKKS